MTLLRSSRILLRAALVALAVAAGTTVATAQPPAQRGDTVEVEAGIRLGPIRVGMSEDEVRALGLAESAASGRSRRFGPYVVLFDARGVRRIEAQMGDLRRIRVRGTVIELGTHIHRIRDAFGSCEWQEGGGERYRCAGGTLHVRTTHSLDPARYTITVERG
jgi:hypothetical protein